MGERRTGDADGLQPGDGNVCDCAVGVLAEPVALVKTSVSVDDEVEAAEGTEGLKQLAELRQGEW